MCGIAGIVDWGGRGRANAEAVRGMIDTLIHRGPDDSGVEIIGDVGLGFRRLAILDLTSTGHQPMRSRNGRVWIVFNGEVYNFLELRAECEARGVQFRGRSDTEVILALYELHGSAFVSRLRGMFAIALWDSEKEELLLVRDRLGKKPLYYATIDNQIIFASELKAISRPLGLRLSRRAESLKEYFTFGYISAPKTVYNEVFKVPPGTTLTVRRNGNHEERYWRPTRSESAPLSADAALDGLRDRLRTAVRLRMISDVPIGAFLSGGIDSSLVVALMAEQSSTPVRTFAVGFSDQEVSELPFARAVAERLGTEHTEEIVEPDATALLDRILPQFDEPFGDSSALPTYIVSAVARKHVTVALSGDGGDESFAGYDLYAIALRERRFDLLPRWLRTAVRRSAPFFPETFRGGNMLHRMGAASPQDRYVERCRLMSEREHRNLLTEEFLSLSSTYTAEDEKRTYFRLSQGWPFLTQLQHNDLCHYLPEDILVKVDRMSMFNSLEIRSPLLDHHVVEYALGLDPEHHVRQGERKHLLKQILRQYLPEPLITRPKRGFSLPLRSWFSGQLRSYLHDHLLSERMRTNGIFRPDGIRDLLKIHDAGHRDVTPELWLLLAYAHWERHQGV